MAGVFTLDGYPIRVAFQVLSGIVLEANILVEREVKPPKVEVGEIDVKTMRHSLWRPKVPKQLRSVGDINLQTVYDPHIYGLAHSHLGVLTQMYIALPAGATDVLGVVTFTKWLYFAKVWIDSVDPQSHQEGELPTMEWVVKPTMLSTGPSFLTEQAVGTMYGTTLPF